MSKNYENNRIWAVHATNFEADLFTQGFVSEHMILATVTVGCPSNGRHASSISDLPALAAQNSTGGTACSLLPWLAVLPLGHPSTHTHILIFSSDVSLTPQPTSQCSYWGIRCSGFTGSGWFSSWALPSSIVFVLLARRGQHGQQTTAIGRG